MMYKLIEGICAMRKSTTISCSVGEHRETLKLTKKAEYTEKRSSVRRFSGPPRNLHTDLPNDLHWLRQILL